MPTIYEFDVKYQEIWDKLDADEIDLDMAMSMLDGLEEEQGNKIDNIAMLAREFEANATARKKESDRLADTSKIYKNRSDRIKKWLCDYMTYANMKKHEGRCHTVSVRENKSVNILDEERIPQEFMRHVPESWNVDKVKIKAALKDPKNVIDGAEIKITHSLNIK